MDDLAPIVGDLGQAEGLAEINQVEDVLLETGTAETNRCLEELGADARVRADGAGDLIDIRAGGFTEGGDRVDRGNALGEEGVGDELGKLGRPEVGGDDALARDPSGIDRGHRLDRGVSGIGGLAADQDAVRVFEVGHGGALGEELGIGEHLEGGAAGGIGGDDGLDGAGGFDRDGAFLDDDLVAVGNLGDQARGGLDVAQIGGTAGSDAVGLGRRADADEDQVGGGDGVADVGGEMQVAAAGGGDHGVEAGFIDGQFVGVPGIDAMLVHVADGHPDVRALGGDHGHGGAADVTGTEAADGGDFHNK